METQLSEAELELQKIYEEKQKNGLVHVSFFTRPLDASVTREDLAKDILALEKAIQKGKVMSLDFGDLSIVKSD